MRTAAIQVGVLAILSSWGPVSPAFAERIPPEPASARAQLQMEDAVRESLRANRDLQTATFVIEQARGRLLQAGLWPNPALDVSGTDDSAFADNGEYSVNVGFEQRFSVAGRIGRAKDVARVDVAIALAEVRDAARRMIGEVQSAFSGLLVLNAQIAERAHLIEIVSRLVSVSQARAKLAEVSSFDVTTARIEQQRLESERDLFLAERWAKSAELNRLLGRAPEESINPTGEVVAALAAPAQETLLSEALQRRPDLQQALLQSDRARAELKLAQADRWEDWTLGFGYDRDRQVVDGAPRQSADQLLGLRLTVPLPLWNRNQGRIAEVQGTEAQARSRSSALELTIAAEIAAAYRRVHDLRQVVANYRTNLIALADGNVRVAEDAYRSGLVGMVEVVQAQRQQSELRNGYLEALERYQQASIALEVASATNPQLEAFGEVQ